MSSFPVKPYATKLSISEENVEEGEAVNLTCTAQANPEALYYFYADEKLLGNSSSGVYSVTSARLEDSGSYKCVPSNFLGEGPAASVSLDVQGK